MYNLNPDCWVWSTRLPLHFLPQHSGSPASCMLRHPEEEEEEEAGENPAVCCYTAGGDVAVRTQAVDAHRATPEPSLLSGIPSSSEHSRGLPSSQTPVTVIEAYGGNVSQLFTSGRCCHCADMQACAHVCGQREPEGIGHCWPGSLYAYCGVRRNIVLEVVEEVAVEDTVEVIEEDIYTDYHLDPELLQDLYPT